MNYDAVIPTPVGPVGIVCADGGLARIDILTRAEPRFPASSLARRVAEQLERYFSDPARRFDLPLAEADTPFRAQVRAALLAIPVGETRSYGEIAARLGTSARAVGGACRANPLPIVVPCHRVVAARGLGGYDGTTKGARLDIKQLLLKHERRE